MSRPMHRRTRSSVASRFENKRSKTTVRTSHVGFRSNRLVVHTRDGRVRSVWEAFGGRQKYQYMCWRLRCRRTSQHGGGGPGPATACLIGAGMRGVDIKARDSIPLSLSRPLSIFRAPGIQGSRCHQRLPEHLLNSSLC